MKPLVGRSCCEKAMKYAVNWQGYQCIHSNTAVRIDDVFILQIGHIDNIPIRQPFTGISKKTQSKSFILHVSLTERVWEF